MISDFYQQPFPSLDINDTYELREQCLDDAQDFFDYYSDDAVTEYIFATVPKDLKEAKEEIQFCRNLFYFKKGVYWAISQKATNKMVGAIGIYANNQHHCAEICYDLHKDFWRKGITCAAIKKVLPLLEQHGFKRIEAITTEKNIGSTALLEKLGFKHEGRLHKYRHYRGKFADVEMYALT